MAIPTLRSIVLDTTDARRAAEFYRQLLGADYQPGDEPPPAGEPDPKGSDWLVIHDPTCGLRIAFQQVAELPASTWPGTDRPQQLHLDLCVRSLDDLFEQHERAVALGARVLEDRSADPDERLYVYADPDGHPLCLFLTEG